MATDLKTSSYQKYFLNIVALYKQRQDLKEYLELLFSIIAIAAFIVLAIKPTLVTIGSLFTKISVQETTSAALDTKIKNLGIAQSRFNSQEDKIKLLQNAVPDSPEVETYVRQLEGSVQKEKLTLVNTSMSSLDLLVSTSSALQSISPTISLSGNFDSLENFIKDIETLRRPGYITKMEIASGSGSLNLTITPLAPFSE